MLIGIRREDKNRWERRVPLAPADVAALQARGLRFVIQSSPNRIFADGDYAALGVEVAADLWELIRRSPASAAIVLEGEDDQAEEYRGTQLLKMINQAQLKLFPAKYRLRRNTDA